MKQLLVLHGQRVCVTGCGIIGGSIYSIMALRLEEARALAVNAVCM